MVISICHFGGPNFFASLKPVHRLNAILQTAVVTDVIDAKVFSFTSDGNMINTKMANLLPNVYHEEFVKCEHNNHPIFWLNDPILIKWMRHNILTAGCLCYKLPGKSEDLYAN